MSLDATLWAWRQPVTPLQKLVLLSMADRAGEDHTLCPHLERLSFDTGIPTADVQAVLVELERLSILRRILPHEHVSLFQLVGVHGREDAQGNLEGSYEP